MIIELITDFYDQKSRRSDKEWSGRTDSNKTVNIPDIEIPSLDKDDNLCPYINKWNRNYFDTKKREIPEISHDCRLVVKYDGSKARYYLHTKEYKSSYGISNRSCGKHIF